MCALEGRGKRLPLSSPLDDNLHTGHYFIPHLSEVIILLKAKPLPMCQVRADGTASPGKHLRVLIFVLARSNER